MPASRARRAAVARCLAAAWLATVGAATAQTLTVALGGDAGAGVRARVALHDLRVRDDTFEVGVGRVQGGFTIAASWRRTLAAGPLGTLVFDARAGLDDRGWGTGTSLRGTLGPVALRLDLDGGSRPPAAWSALTRASAAPGLAAPDAARGAETDAPWRIDASLAAVWRVDRVWTIDAAPRVHVATTGWAGGIAGGVRRGGVAPETDLSLRIDAATGAAGRHAAIGVTLHHVPRRAPESRLTAWWAGTRGPGLEVAWTARSGVDQLSFTLATGPAWADRPGMQWAAAWQRPWQEGTLAASLRVGDDATAWELGWSRPLRP